MEGIKAWVMSVCFAGMAAGILQHIAPQNTRNSVLKLVLTLYILVAAFAPIQALKYPETRISVPKAGASTATVDAAQLIRAQSELNIKSELEAACAAQGINAAITVSFDGYDIKSVTVDSNEATAVIAGILGENVTVYVDDGEEK